MNPNSYTSADVPVPKTGQHWDPAGEYESQDTLYTLIVYVPPRPPSKYLPSFLTREPLHVSKFHVIQNDRTGIYHSFERRDLRGMDTKFVKIKSYRFPPELRCKHVQTKTTCEEGCYVLEKGGVVKRRTCGREDCEGHVYSGNVKVGEGGVKCFGKKGARLVCFEGTPG